MIALCVTDSSNASTLPARREPKRERRGQGDRITFSPRHLGSMMTLEFGGVSEALPPPRATIDAIVERRRVPSDENHYEDGQRGQQSGGDRILH